MNDDIFKLIDILKWPGAFVLLGLGSVLLLKGELSRLLRRTRTASRSGFEFEPESQHLPSPNRPSSASELLQSWDNRLLVAQEETIRETLSRASVSDPCERERYLIRLAAGSNLVAQMEQIYNMIIHSQVLLLRALNQAPIGMVTDAVRAGFEAASEKEPFLKTVKMEDWVAYLVNRGLVEVDKDGIFTIATLGREFLKYMVEQGKPEKAY